MIGSTRTSPIRMGWSSARRSCHVIPYRASRYEKTESDQSPGPVCSMLAKGGDPNKYQSTRSERMRMSRHSQQTRLTSARSLVASVSFCSSSSPELSTR